MTPYSGSTFNCSVGERGVGGGDGRRMGSGGESRRMEGGEGRVVGGGSLKTIEKKTLYVR